MDHETVTEAIPPETTTPMPDCLWYVYDHSLGWPGKPEKFVSSTHKAYMIDPALAVRRCA